MAGTGQRTVEVVLTFKVKSPDNVDLATRVIQKTANLDQATQLFPQNIAASQSNVQLDLGGVTQAKWVLLEVDHEVTLKLNQNTDTGFPCSGVYLVESDSGITSIFVSTGANATCVQLLAVGT